MATDLSEHHAPLTDLFARLAPSDEGKQFELSEEQLQFYHDNGYVAGVQLFDDAQLEVLRSELADLVLPMHEGHDLWYEYHSNESGNPDAILFHALGAWRVRPALHDTLWNPAFLVPASQLLGGSVRFWHDQLFCKPARDGGVVAWHQDYSYWTRTKPMNHLTCWIGLDDSTVENGCVQYIPSSHRWDLLPTTDLANNMEAIRSVLNQDQLRAFQPVPIPLKAGQCSFHHPMIVHGSYENRSTSPRRAIVLNVFEDGTISDHDEPLLNGTEPIPKGQKIDGRFHPLLFERSKNR